MNFGQILTSMVRTEDKQALDYRDKKQEAEKDTARQAKLSQIHAELAEANACLKRGELYNGKIAAAAVSHLEFAAQAANNELAASERARAALVGLCPDENLQREWRDLQKNRKLVFAGIASAKQRVTEQEIFVRREQKKIDDIRHPMRTAEKNEALRLMARAQRDLAELRDELASLEAERVSLDAARDELRQRMQNVEV